MINQDLFPHLKGKTILITGGSGFFGKNLCESLSSLGMTVYALSRGKIEMPGVHTLQHDVTENFPFDFKTDFIIHAATPVVKNENFEAMMDVIVNGTRNALDYAKKSQCKKFLLVSSGAVYGEQASSAESIAEDHEINAKFFDSKSGYSTGKRISELMARDFSETHSVDVTIARCFAFSGKFLPIDQHLAIGNFVHDALHSSRINVKGDGSALRSYMDADDLVNWLTTILLKGKKGETYNVGSDEKISMKELANKVAAIAGGIEVIIQNQKDPNSKRNIYIPSVEKAKSELNLNLTVSLDDSINKMLKFYRELK